MASAERGYQSGAGAADSGYAPSSGAADAGYMTSSGERGFITPAGCSAYEMSTG